MTKMTMVPKMISTEEAMMKITEKKSKNLLKKRRKPKVIILYLIPLEGP